MTKEEFYKNATDVVCEECGNNTFREVFLVKRVSKLLVGADKDIIDPIATLACAKCGHINEDMMPKTSSPVIAK